MWQRRVAVGKAVPCETAKGLEATQLGFDEGSRYGGANMVARICRSVMTRHHLITEGDGGRGGREEGAGCD